MIIFVRQPTFSYDFSTVDFCACWLHFCAACDDTLYMYSKNTATHKTKHKTRLKSHFLGLFVFIRLFVRNPRLIVMIHSFLKNGYSTNTYGALPPNWTACSCVRVCLCTCVYVMLEKIVYSMSRCEIIIKSWIWYVYVTSTNDEMHMSWHSREFTISVFLRTSNCLWGFICFRFWITLTYNPYRVHLTYFFPNCALIVTPAAGELMGGVGTINRLIYNLIYGFE